MNVQARTAGPTAPGGIPTFSGIADGKTVHWLGYDQSRADQLERTYRDASPLKKLLIRNAYTLEGLTRGEFIETHRLIGQVPETKDSCWVCHGDARKAIADTGLCRDHNLQALASRK